MSDVVCREASNPLHVFVTGGPKTLGEAIDDAAIPVDGGQIPR
jgi:hypothetical protein